MRDNYRELAEQIHVPEGMNERVLETVRMQCTANGTGESAKMNRKPMLRAAVCAVLALVLVAGSVSLRSNGDLKQLERVGFEEVCPVGLPLSYEFGLTAYAADAIPAANGNLVLEGGKSSGTIIDTTDLVPEREQYTSYRFRIYGEQIESLTMSIDRGGLYRSEDGKKTVLSGTTVERYDPNVVYGLWVPPAEFLQGRGISVLSGALLTVTVRFSDETEQSNIYRLFIISFWQLTTDKACGIVHNVGKSALMLPTCLYIFIACSSCVTVRYVNVDNVSKIFSVITKDSGPVCNRNRKSIFECKAAKVSNFKRFHSRVTRLPLIIIKYFMVGIVLHRRPTVAHLVQQVDFKSAGLNFISRICNFIGKPCKSSSNK